MEPITSRTELRWALEDMGDAGRPVLQYLQGFFEYSDALARTARITVAELRDEAEFCAAYHKSSTTGIYEYGGEWDDTENNLKTWAEDLEYVIEEYEQC